VSGRDPALVSLGCDEMGWMIAVTSRSQDGDWTDEDGLRRAAVSTLGVCWLFVQDVEVIIGAGGMVLVG